MRWADAELLREMRIETRGVSPLRIARVAASCVPALLFVVLLAVGWELMAAQIHSPLIPTLCEIARELDRIVRSGLLLPQLAITLGRVGLGFLAAAAADDPGPLSTALAEYHEPVPYLNDLVALEVGKRPENGIRNRIAAAHVPTLKTMEAFDFAIQPQLPKAKLLEHFDGAFVRQHRNLVLYGPPGTGKTHCLIALGIATCTHGFRVRFTTAAELLMSLIEAKHNGMLERKFHALERFDLLLIDELGYIPFEREQTDLLFNVISARYERASLAITTNLALIVCQEVVYERGR
jgi:DNA replication protein DnaC